jgi:NitT/TauT family transport system substrate-binding protein
MPVRIIEYPSASDAIRSFRNGVIEVAALTLDEALILKQDELDIRIVLVMDYSCGADVVMAQRDVSSLSALKGKRIGVETSALGAYMLNRMTRKAGMDISDYTVIPMGVDQHEQAFKERRVDAVVTFEPVRTRLLKAGARILFDSREIPGEILDVLVVRKDILERRPEEVGNLLKKWFQALDFMRSNSDDATTRMAARLGFSGEELRGAMGGIRVPDREENLKLLSGTPPAINKAARNMSDSMLRVRLLRRIPDTENMADAGPLRRMGP